MEAAHSSVRWAQKGQFHSVLNPGTFALFCLTSLLLPLLQGSWTLIREYQGANARDSYGDSASGLSDVTRRWSPRLGAIAAPGMGNGQVHVYSGATGGLFYSVLTPAPHDGFGRLIRDLGDLDGDGFHDFGVHANQWGDALCIYSGWDGSMIHYWQGIGPGGYGNRGQSIMAIGDADGDCVNEILVGDPGYTDAAGIRVGATFLYSGSTGSILARIEVPPVPNGDGGSFGAAVAGGADLDGDGIADFCATMDYDSPQFELFSGATRQSI